MSQNDNEIFGIHRTTLLVLAVAVTFGSFSVYKALGVGRTERSEVPAITDLGTAIFTKADAPRPAVKTTLTPIEQIQVGDRVLAESPTGGEDTAFGSEIIPSDWRKLTLRAPKRDGTVAEVVLLRPLKWLNEQHGEVGGTVFISVPECGIDGNARVLAIEPCPEIAAGAGRVVTGTFRHRAARTLDLTIAGESRPIGCTGNHPFWSETRQTFVRADSLHPGETLRTSTGLTTVVSTTIVPGETFVYNLEVHGAHVFHVGTSGVLVHNGNDDCFEVVYRAMSEAEYNKLLANNGLSIRPLGSHELGVALNRSYLDELIRKHPDQYTHIVEFRLKPGSIESLTAQSGRHNSLGELFSDLPEWHRGFSGPQLKLERGFLKFLLGGSDDAVNLFNSMLSGFGRVN